MLWTWDKLKIGSFRPSEINMVLEHKESVRAKSKSLPYGHCHWRKVPEVLHVEGTQLSIISHFHTEHNKLQLKGLITFLSTTCNNFASFICITTIHSFISTENDIILEMTLKSAD